MVKWCKGKLINNLNVRVKMFSNVNRQLKRQLSSTLNDYGELEESSDQSSLLMAATSPAAKWQATK